MKRINFVASTLILLVTTRSAFAEGDKSSDPRWAAALGANRVVRSVSAHPAVMGRCILPTAFFLPSVNPRKSNPTMYFGGELTDPTPGGKGTIQVDAGVYYETTKYPGVPVGWASDIYAQALSSPAGTPNAYFLPTVSYADGTRGPFRMGPGSQNPGVDYVDMIYSVLPGGAVNLRLTLHSTSAIQNGQVEFSFQNGVQVIPANSRELVNAKRVIGVNQLKIGGAEWGLDNTFVQGAQVQNMQLLYNGTIPEFKDWVVADTQQDRTGYKPGGQDQSSPPKFIIDFPGITAMANAAGVTNMTTVRANWHNDANVPGRYLNEAVDINLNAVGVVKGNRITPLRVAPTSN